MKKKSFLTATDQFCGAGGSSIGATNAGVEVKMAMNHWKLAIETHNTNFPDTDHDCTDISACDPRRYPSTDILITSPECTNHSVAKGKEIVKKQMQMFGTGIIDAAAERSRATMWDVVRFAEFHKYESIVVENVVDAKKWIMFDSWLHAMYALGYKHKCVYLNSMHVHPTPQSRDRMYVVFWKKGNMAPNLDLTPKAFCPKCNSDINSVQSFKKNQQTYKYKTGYVYCCPFCSTVVEPYYYAAFNCIDWTDPGQRIGGRTKDLSENTIARIQYGLDKYRKPLERTKSMPYIIKLEHNGTIRPATDPLQTQTTCQGQGFVTVPGQVWQKPHTGIVTDYTWNSFLAAYYTGSMCTKHITEEMGTVTTGDRMTLINYQKPNIDDCYYRMLKPHEIKAAMAFQSGYKILGNSREQVKQCGNAVTPPAMEFLIRQVVSALS